MHVSWSLPRRERRLGRPRHSHYDGSPPEPRGRTESRARTDGPPHTRMTRTPEPDSDPDSAVGASPDVETSRYRNKSPYPFGLPGRESPVSRWSDDSDAPDRGRSPSSCDSHEEYAAEWEEEPLPHGGKITSTSPTGLGNSLRSQGRGSASASDQLSDRLMPCPVRSPQITEPKSRTDSILTLLGPLPSAEAQQDRPPYAAWSPEGQRRLRYIRHALSMPDDSPAEAVQDFLARNPSVIRHLAYNTVGHPDWTFDDGGADGAEVRVSGAAVDRNLLLYQAITDVFWKSKRIWDVLDMAAEPTCETEWTLRVWYRKRRRDVVPPACFSRMLDEEPDLVMEDHQRKALAKEIRLNRPDSLLKFSTAAADIDDRHAQGYPDVDGESYY
ncbi:Uncharacterized protein TCAP_06463 [Tolypocladium capitatum]|uniref:Uncharacterized protein n=1 Tax=Tolypocladium capitatum TaxID=45235 RepID=A0A2K3Q7X9_9HYPO|nr:Uncharacterized protein TCAP_06463 [Tolypocladium capitatum]